jgi:hypothetical protein
MLNRRKILKITLVTSYVALSSVLHGDFRMNDKQSISLMSSSQIPSVNQEAVQLTVESICPSGKKTFVTAHTKNHWIHICGDEQPTDFIGHSKTDKGGIVLPLTESQHDQFIAENGDVVYTLTPEFIIVTQNGRILRQDLIEHQFGLSRR